MTQTPPSRRQDGFTLIEGITTLSLSALVLSLGIPSMQHLIAASRITSEANLLTAHLHLARSEAVKRRLPAVLCPSKDGNQCMGSQDWGQGYMVFIDADNDSRFDAGESVLRHHAMAASLDIDAGKRKTVKFQATGWAPGSNLTITLCDGHDRAAPKAVIVARTGRTRTDDIHPSGRPLKCS